MTLLDEILVCEVPPIITARIPATLTCTEILLLEDLKVVLGVLAYEAVTVTVYVVAGIKEYAGIVNE
jgi:hypothetical protein